MLRVEKPGISKRRGSGADDETTRRDSEGHGEEDQLAGGGGDHRGMRPDDAPDAGGVSEVWLHRPEGAGLVAKRRKRGPHR